MTDDGVFTVTPAFSSAASRKVGESRYFFAVKPVFRIDSPAESVVFSVRCGSPKPTLPEPSALLSSTPELVSAGATRTSPAPIRVTGVG